jgi:hypothetical protein
MPEKVQGPVYLVFKLLQLGTTEKAKSTPTQLVSGFEIRKTGEEQGNWRML